MSPAATSTVATTTGRPRRTQAERRAETTDRLLDATLEALADVGWARTTAQEVSARSGISQGGLFRRFPTMLDLVVAAADRLRARQFESFRAGVDAGAESPVELLRLLRQRCREPDNAAWYELLAAARTDSALRERLAPLAATYHAEIAAYSRTLPAAAGVDPALLEAVVFTLVHALDGEALSATVHPQPEQEEARLVLLASLLRA